MVSIELSLADSWKLDSEYKSLKEFLKRSLCKCYNFIEYHKVAAYKWLIEIATVFVPEWFTFASEYKVRASYEYFVRGTKPQIKLTTIQVIVG